jgi:hypothetical protein
MQIRSLAVLIFVSSLTACASMSGTTRPSAPTVASTMAAADMEPGSAGWWQQEMAPLKAQGQLTDTTYIATILRDDLWVQSELGDIPVSAGLASKFYFWRCTCGLGKVVGEFVVADYEANDVVDALRSGQITVVGMSPMLMTEKPRMMSVRFQAEGKMEELVKTLRGALDWTGPMRATTQPAMN